MSYTWGYIKDASLVKLDVSTEGAIQQGLLNKFVVYANEAMTQICSAVKPKYTYATFKVRNQTIMIEELQRIYHLEDMSFLDVNACNLVDLPQLEQDIYAYYHSFVYLSDLVKMPQDFISFGGDAPILTDVFGNRFEAHDTDFNYKGSQLIFFAEGDYVISYNARWFFFTPSTDNDEILDVPADVIDCLPSYIAAQCFKIDDESKSAIMRNEFELAVARIDATHFEQNITFKVSGGW